MARGTGVNVRLDKQKAARNQPEPWGVFIEASIPGRPPLRKAAFYATEAEALAVYPAAVAKVAALRQEAEQQLALHKALQVPLPQAPKGTILFATLAKRWLDERVAEMCEAKTARNYKGLLDNHLLPIMGTWPVNDATMETQRIKQVLRVDLFDKGVGLPTRIACQRTLSACFAWIKSELPGRLLTHNPAADLGKELRRKSEKKIKLKPPANPMTRAQAEAFIAWQDKHYPEVADLFVWLIDEGSRVSEACALKWAHLDLTRGMAHIQEAFSYAQRQQELAEGNERGAGEKDTKTHRTDQHIDLSRRVVTRLTARLASNREGWLARGKKPEHVFLNRDGSPRRPDKTLYKAFRAGCDALELRGETGKPFTIHCLRDTFATLALLEGKALGWVSMMLGHADSRTTLKHYVKWIRQVEGNLLDAVDTGDGE